MAESDAISQAIASIEASRASKVIVYITGDRQLVVPPAPPGTMTPNLTAIVHQEVLPYFSEALKSLGSTQKISLVIYTNGGDISAPWPLVNLIREYCEEFEVVVLRKALSAGTLIALGADRVIMPRESFLSPIDPSRVAQNKNKELTQLEIEDIIGFIDFAKDKIGINDQATLGEVLKELSKEIDPSTIGSINRTHSLIRRLAEKLLDLHKDKVAEHQKKELIEQLTAKLFSHTHLISRREAKDIGLNGIVEDPSASDEKLFDKLYNLYRDSMKLNDPLNPERIISEQATEVMSDSGYLETCLAALIHTQGLKYSNELLVNIKGVATPNGPQNNVAITPLGWRKD